MILTVKISQLVQATKDAIGNAQQALSTIYVLEEWKGALENIKWVINLVGNVAGVNFVSFLFSAAS